MPEKKKSDESFQEFSYHTMKLAAQASLEPGTVIKYVIRKIPDTAVKKACFDGTKAFKELKERLRQYQENRSKDTK